VTPASIIKAIAARHMVTVSALKAGSNKAHLADARQHACAELRKAGLSYEEIAKAVGYKDHTTASYAVRKWDEKMISRRAMLDGVSGACKSLPTTDVGSVEETTMTPGQKSLRQSGVER
jgi:chromosomal replication initiation ATPase DnaA